MQGDFEQNIERLLQKFHGARQDFVSQIGEWRNEYRKALLAANLHEHSVIQEFVAHLFDEIEGINYRLQNEKSVALPETERDRLIDKRELYAEFIYIFVAAKKKVESIAQSVEENLK